MPLFRPIARFFWPLSPCLTGFLRAIGCLLSGRCDYLLLPRQVFLCCSRLPPIDWGLPGPGGFEIRSCINHSQKWVDSAAPLLLALRVGCFFTLLPVYFRWLLGASTDGCMFFLGVIIPFPLFRLDSYYRSGGTHESLPRYTWTRERGLPAFLTFALRIGARSDPVLQVDPESLFTPPPPLRVICAIASRRFSDSFCFRFFPLERLPKVVPPVPQD